MAYNVTPNDLADRWRPLTSAEQTKVLFLLEAAERMLDAAIPSLAGRVAAGKVDEKFVGDIMVAMVLRVMRNPEGHRQGSHQIDDYSSSWTVDNALSTGELYISDGELDLLSQPSGSTGVGTIRLGVPAVLQSGVRRGSLDREDGRGRRGPAWR